MTALGVSLLVIGAIVVVVEAHVPTLGLLGGPGVLALGAGAILAVSGLGGGVLLGVLSALLVVALGMGVLAVSLRKGMSVRRRRVRSGPEGMVGHIGTVHSWSEQPDDLAAAQSPQAGSRARAARGGKVLVDGALWRAKQCWGDEEPADLHAGDPIVVEHLTGLTLRVRPAEDWELSP
jgi:membrane-bound serine protease (ClpP class)